MRSFRGSALLFTLIVSGIVLALATASLSFVRYERIQTQRFTQEPYAEQVAGTAAEHGLAIVHRYAEPKTYLENRPDTSDATLSGAVPINDPTTFGETIDLAYELDFSSYDYPDHPVFVASVPSENLEIEVTLTTPPPPTKISIARWEIHHTN